MDQPAVEFLELCQHRLVFFVREVGSGCGKEYLVFLLNVPGVEVYQYLQLLYYVIESRRIAIAKTGVGSHDGNGGLPSENVLFDKLIHDLTVLERQFLLAQVSKQYVFFLTVVSPVNIHLNEIDCCVKKTGLYTAIGFNPFQGIFDQGDHPFYQAVLHHELPTRLHNFFLSPLQTRIPQLQYQLEPGYPGGEYNAGYTGVNAISGMLASATVIHLYDVPVEPMLRVCCSRSLLPGSGFGQQRDIALREKAIKVAVSVDELGDEQSVWGGFREGLFQTLLR